MFFPLSLRQEEHGVQPHHIPVISDEKATEGIEHAEGGDCRVVFAGGALELSLIHI